MRIAYLTAGAAGMYCGSCMHDNALARELSRHDAECLLLPVYTPIRTDEPDVSRGGQVFFGGINVYLQQKWPLLGKLPGPLLRLLDAPWLLRLATKRAGGTQASLLGDLTVSMLQGLQGHQASEVKRLVAWLRDEFRPDVIVLTNLLIGGCIPAIREVLDTKIVVWLQGDDIFLDYLPEAYRGPATELMGALAAQTDACLVNSQFYADKMGNRLGIHPDKLHVVPLAIDTNTFAAEAVDQEPRSGDSTALDAALASVIEDHLPAGGRNGKPLKLGYFARIAPEKGFHNLVDAFIEVSSRLGSGRLQLHYGGWLGDQHRDYLHTQQKRLDAAGLAAAHFHHGSPERDAKIALLRSFDLFSVPTDYEECKGLYVLESLAAGVPVIQPQHGAFPELLASTGGGLLYPANDPAAYAECLLRLLENASERTELGLAGQQGVLSRHTIAQQAAEFLRIVAG
ncbi:glycosyltransferase family 4 protein [Planctomycetaceae bacterium SH139]